MCKCVSGLHMSTYMHLAFKNQLNVSTCYIYGIIFKITYSPNNVGKLSFFCHICLPVEMKVSVDTGY